jgi:hypothetical protein
MSEFHCQDPKRCNHFAFHGYRQVIVQSVIPSTQPMAHQHANKGYRDHYLAQTVPSPQSAMVSYYSPSPQLLQGAIYYPQATVHPYYYHYASTLPQEYSNCFKVYYPSVQGGLYPCSAQQPNVSFIVPCFYC